MVICSIFYTSHHLSKQAFGFYECFFRIRTVFVTTFSNVFFSNKSLRVATSFFYAFHSLPTTINFPIINIISQACSPCSSVLHPFERHNGSFDIFHTHRSIFWTNHNQQKATNHEDFQYPVRRKNITEKET